MEEKLPGAFSQALPVDRTDDAVEYLQGHAAGPDSSQIDLRALRRKIDWHLIPFMFSCYVLQFLDKVMLNVSRRKLPANTPLIDARGDTVCCRHGNENGTPPRGE